MRRRIDWSDRVLAFAVRALGVISRLELICPEIVTPASTAGELEIVCRPRCEPPALWRSARSEAQEPGSRARRCRATPTSYFQHRPGQLLHRLPMPVPASVPINA